MTASAAALALLAAMLVLGGGASAPRRLRALNGPPSAAPTAGVGAPPGPAVIAVAALALAGMAWAGGAGTGGVLLGSVVGAGAVLVLRRAALRAADDADEPAVLAAAWERLAVCLRVGLPVAAAVQAAAGDLRGGAGVQLRRVAGLLALGADPAHAWREAGEQPQVAGFARAASRSAGTGAALAEVARAEGGRIRAELVDTAEARAQRAAVTITGPLGLCFLPAFVALGIAPVVISLAGEALARW
jgi:pilus assembly protein TadC